MAEKKPTPHPADPFASLFDARSMGMTDEQFARFRMACDHPYTCKCEACLDWWELVGPEPEDQ